MPWISTAQQMPPLGQPVMCRLRHCSTRSIQTHRLVKVDESDCDWRTADDRAELSFDWDVIEWESLPVA